MFVVCHCVHASVPVGVVSVLFDSLIHSVMPLSLFSCLQSSVGSTLLFRLKVRSSARQPNSQTAQAFQGFIFQTLCSSRDGKRAKDSKETGIDRRAEGKSVFVGQLTVIPCPVFV